MIADDTQLATTLERVSHFQQQVAHLRRTVASAANDRAASGAFLAEIDRMQREVREYLLRHPSELATA